MVDGWFVLNDIDFTVVSRDHQVSIIVNRQRAADVSKDPTDAFKRISLEIRVSPNFEDLFVPEWKQYYEAS